MKQEIYDIISMSLERDCINLKDSMNNSNLIESAIVSLIVNDFCGGKIMRCMVDGIGHYYNLINNNIVDLTFLKIKEYASFEEQTRECLLLNSDIKNGYRELLINVKNNFLQYGIINYKLRDENNNQYISKVPGTLGGHKKLKIYGKLDCKSALYWIKKGQYIDNRVFFSSEETAIAAGYRPCAKCMKKEYDLWKQNNN